VAVASAGLYANLHLTTDSHANMPPVSFFTGRMPFLPPNQQRQSTEGKLSPWRPTSYIRQVNGVNWRDIM